jgi:hypothetical protein
MHGVFSAQQRWSQQLQLRMAAAVVCKLACGLGLLLLSTVACRQEPQAIMAHGCAISAAYAEARTHPQLQPWQLQHT